MAKNRNQIEAEKLKLLDKQQLFSRLLAALLVHIHMKGYNITVDEAFRPNVTAKIYAEQGKGSKNSLHRLKLAIDLNLFKGHVYITTPQDYHQFGEFWESLGGTWGGRFQDYRHFSIEHNGVK